MHVYTARDNRTAKTSAPSTGEFPLAHEQSLGVEMR